MVKKQRRLKHEDRKERILKAILKFATKHGYYRIKLKELTRYTKASESLICYYFGPVKQLEKIIMEEAIKRECIPVIIQGWALNDPLALKVSNELKTKIIKHLTELE